MRFWIVAALLLLTGCVSRGRHRDLEMAYAGSQARVAELTEAVKTYERIYRESRDGVIRAERRALGK